MHYWLVMPAAGAGRRFGGPVPKQHAPLAAATLLEVALRPFLNDARCGGGVLVMAQDDRQREALRQRLPPKFEFAVGGAQRAHSVLNGLAALASRAASQDWVLVHDAVRPCLSAGDLEHLLQALSRHPLGGLLAVPVADTVKQAELGPDTDASAECAALAGGAHTRGCAATVSRETLWLAQTPQMFRYRPLLQAMQQALASGRVPTDEAQAMEWQGTKPRLVAAQDLNMKVTNAADLQLAAAILALRPAHSTRSTEESAS